MLTRAVCSNYIVVCLPAFVLRDKLMFPQSTAFKVYNYSFLLFKERLTMNALRPFSWVRHTPFECGSFAFGFRFQQPLSVWGCKGTTTFGFCKFLRKNFRSLLALGSSRLLIDSRFSRLLRAFFCFGLQMSDSFLESPSAPSSLFFGPIQRVQTHAVCVGGAKVPNAFQPAQGSAKVIFGGGYSPVSVHCLPT